MREREREVGVVSLREGERYGTEVWGWQTMAVAGKRLVVAGLAERVA